MLFLCALITVSTKLKHAFYLWLRLINLGLNLFFVGMAINIHSDDILRNLRKPGETGYKIPRGTTVYLPSCSLSILRMTHFKITHFAGGMFEFVSGTQPSR